MSDNNKNLMLAAPCGIYCGLCPAYKAKDDEGLKEDLIKKGLKREQLPCPGCREVKGHCPAIQQQCETYICTVNKDAQFCFDCSEYPCERLNPASDRASTLPHNLKVFNLCYIKEQGLEKYIEEAPKIQYKYYLGKMTIGKGPQIEK
ncbi:MAG: DUF3795 domain-containing protein [Firmicutes bacterium]|nr:DUF3795 domain-containing protein [Bacillota bacterium]